jgi:hypothetical protein
LSPFALAILTSIQDTSPEFNCSVTSFIASSADLYIRIYTSNEESIQTHTTAMKAYLDDFDAVFSEGRLDTIGVDTRGETNRRGKTT